MLHPSCPEEIWLPKMRRDAVDQMVWILNLLNEVHPLVQKLRLDLQEPTLIELAIITLAQLPKCQPVCQFGLGFTQSNEAEEANGGGCVHSS